MIVPAFPTLFAKATRDKLGYERPSLWTILLNKVANKVVLVFSPGLLPEYFVPGERGLIMFRVGFLMFG